MGQNFEIRKQDKKEQLRKLLSEAFMKRKGNKIRKIMKIVAKTYKNNSEELREYFNDKNELIAGIATSAYHFLTGNIEPIQIVEYGGLGAIINDSEPSLEFGREQLNFARLTGNALHGSNNSGNALKNSKNSGDALDGSENSGNALYGAVNLENALCYSRNLGNTLWDSINSDKALYGSINSDYSLWESINSGDALKDSENSDHVLCGSVNLEKVTGNIKK